MAGKRYDLTITRGAYQGARARFIENSKCMPNAALIEIKNARTFAGDPITIHYPWNWLLRTPQKTTRTSPRIFPTATPEEARPDGN